MPKKANVRPRTRPNRQRYTHRCEWCGSQFKSARPYARTCSNAHRLRWARWCREVKNRGRGKPVIGPRGDMRKQFFIGENENGG